MLCALFHHLPLHPSRSLTLDVYRASKATRRASSTTRVGPTSRSCGGASATWTSTRCAILNPTHPDRSSDSTSADGNLRQARHPGRDGAQLSAFPAFSTLVTCSHLSLLDDYGWQDFSALAVQASASGKAASTSNPYRQRCFCGADVCTGWMGGKKNKKEEEKPLTPRKRGPKPKPKIGDAASKEPATWLKPADIAGTKKMAMTAEAKGKGKEVLQNSPVKTPGKVVGAKAAEGSNTLTFGPN